MPDNPSASGRRRIKELEVMVAEAIRETHDTTTLVLFTGNDRLEYEAGHFLTIHPAQFEALERFRAYLEDQKGRREPPRAYSLSSAPDERYLAITVKEERYIRGVTPYPPLLSPLLVRRTPLGTRMVVTGFTGPYTLPNDIESRTDHVVHVCAGSGIVPTFSILKFALRHYPRLRHSLVYGNKTVNDVIFRRQLDAIQHEHPDRLRIVHALTRQETPQESDSPRANEVRHGRVSLDLIREVVRDAATAHWYVCGPAISSYERKRCAETGSAPPLRFMESVLAALTELGVSKDRIETESYG